ncbi:MAG TPA: COX15/CtaA family protein [Acidimicrobiales bacterium]|nr:COX15/CtaA family protein [Acidimicrobiales bacterium]
MLPTVGPRPFLRVTQVTLGLVVLNIVSGAAVRLSDSGLGCPDWPTCSRRHLTPPLSLHPAVEFGNRMVVVALCLAAALCVVAALRRRPYRRDLLWLSVGLVGGVLGEAVLGGLVVYAKLNPYVVMTHFMVGIALLTVAVALSLRAGREPGPGVSMVHPSVRTLSAWCLLVLVVAIAAGTGTTGAGPHAGGKGAVRIPVPLADMARTHSSIVIALGAMTLALLYLLDRTRAPEKVTGRGRAVLVVMVAQGFVGYTQYFTHLPPLLVGVHVFGATVLWAAFLWFHDGLSHHGTEDGPAPEDGEGRLRVPRAAAGGAGDGDSAARQEAATLPARPDDAALSRRPTVGSPR